MQTPRVRDAARELDLAVGGLRGLSGGSSESPRSLVRYVGGRDPRGVEGIGLLLRGPVKVRIGRGR